MLHGRSYLYCSPEWLYLNPKIYSLRSSSGCRTIDYTILPLSFWYPPPLAHPPRLIRRWQCPSISVLATRYYIPQTQKLKPYYFPRAAIPPLPDPIQIQDTFVPWTSTVRYLGLVLHSKLLFTRHLHTVANKATGVFCNIFPFLARDSAFTQSNKLALNKLLIRFILIYASPVSSSTCSPTTTDFK